MTPVAQEILWSLGKIVFFLSFVFTVLPLMIWGERKGAAFIQDRIGPNRASIGGLLRVGGTVHSLADVLKLVFKEDVIPDGVNRFFYTLAPFLVMVVALLTFAVIPFGDALYLGDKVIPLQVANLNVGVLYILAVTSLSVYGIVLAGWSSANKYSFLGGIRSSAQMISYEINLGLAVLALIMVFGTVRLGGDGSMVAQQGELLFGFLPKWGVVVQPVGFVLFLVSLFAETNRSPFDLPEGESELVSGYHTEYSSLKFALFFMAEYTNMIVGSAIVATLYFGGWQVPFMSTEMLRENAGLVLSGMLATGVVVHLLLAVWLFRRYDRERGLLGDRRELEPLIEGIASATLGFGLAGFLLLGQPWDIGFEASRHVATVAQIGAFVGKTLLFCWLFIWVRWTLPRFRYDQLMRLGWQYMLPLALVNFIATAALVALAG